MVAASITVTLSIGNFAFKITKQNSYFINDLNIFTYLTLFFLLTPLIIKLFGSLQASIEENAKANILTTKLSKNYTIICVQEIID